MGTVTVTVYFANGTPAPDQTVSIQFGGVIFGLGAYTASATTNNDGTASFSGTPSLESGTGKVTSTSGEYSTFTVGTDLWGNADVKQNVYWNPAASITNTVKTAATTLWNGIFAVIIIAIVILVIYVIYKKLGPTIKQTYVEGKEAVLKALPALVAA